MTELLTDLIGFLSAVISFVLFLPQASLTWTNRGNPEALRSVSAGTQYLILCNAILWGVYAMLTEAFWVGAPGLVNAPLAVVTLVLLHRSRRALLMTPADIAGGTYNSLAAMPKQFKA